MILVMPPLRIIIQKCITITGQFGANCEKQTPNSPPRDKTRLKFKSISEVQRVYDFYSTNLLT